MIRVLLVEDNAGDARLIRELLRELPHGDFELTHVGSLAAARTHVAGHDVALVDLTLPDATGLVSVQALVTASRSLPIVVLTGNGDDSTALAALTAGAQDYLVKNQISPPLLGTALRYAIERKKLATLELAKQELEQAVSRAQLIAEITTAATSALDPVACMRAVAPLLVPRLASGCAIDQESDGKRLRIATAGGFEGELALEVALRSRGQVIGSIALHRDLSMRSFGEADRILADEVATAVALGVENAALYQEAQRAIRGRDEMMAIVSHDLRNPLGVVELTLDMIERDPSRMANVIPRARRAAVQMRVLVDDLLQLAQIDAGTFTLSRQPVDLSRFLDELYEHHALLAAEKKVAMDKRLPSTLGMSQIDAHRLGQALGNLLGNAIKFTAAGGQVVLSAELGEQRIAIRVSDTGPGIPQENLSRIFDRFWQADRSRNGIGLGLPIARAIVEAHGGSLGVRSEVGVGTTFDVILPRA